MSDITFEGKVLPMVRPVPAPEDIQTEYFQSVDQAHASIMGQLQGWNDRRETQVIIAYNAEGQGIAWFGVKTEEDRRHILRQLAELTAEVRTREL